MTPENLMDWISLPKKLDELKNIDVYFYNKKVDGQEERN